jgi:hypothetical protein
MNLAKPSGNHHSESIRKLSALSRFPDTPSELVIDWTDNGEYVVLGSDDAVSFDRCVQRIMQALPTSEWSAKTTNVLQEETGETRSTIQRALRELKATRHGTGDKGDPFRYWRTSGPRIVVR